MFSEYRDEKSDNDLRRFVFATGVVKIIFLRQLFQPRYRYIIMTVLSVNKGSGKAYLQ